MEPLKRLYKDNQQVLVFLKDCEKKLEKYNVQVDFIYQEFLSDADCETYGGEFDHKEKLIRVAINNCKTKVLEIFTHEYCHFEQWVDNSLVWQKADRDIFYYDLIDCIDIAELELDCEKRTLNKIKVYELPINEIRYIQIANAYIASYYLMPIFGGWIKSSTDNYALYSKMPKTLDINHKIVAENHVQLFEKLLF